MIRLAKQTGRWVLLCLTLGVLAGTASAWFLRALEVATQWREQHSWIVFLLPTGGFGVGWLYHQYGRKVEGGNNLILEEIHNPREAIPARLAPLIFLGTVWTHVFGGSAGREGTAVQMGGALAEMLVKPFKLAGEERRTILMVGMSAGFASVFGVPWAGTVFGMEVLTRGPRSEWKPALQCGAAAFVAHYVCLAWGIRHTAYARPEIPAFAPSVLLWVLVAALIFALTARVFSWSSHALKALFARAIRYAPFRPVVGGGLLLAGYSALGTMRFAGLGVPVLQSSLTEALPPTDFLWKLLFTVVTLSSGFKGGEVTPLLFIGATLGNALALVVPLHFSFLAALGFVAVFAGCSKTPWACALMAVELFGPAVAGWAVIICLVTAQLSGAHGIYPAQRR